MEIFPFGKDKFVSNEFRWVDDTIIIAMRRRKIQLQVVMLLSASGGRSYSSTLIREDNIDTITDTKMVDTIVTKRL